MKPFKFTFFIFFTFLLPVCIFAQGAPNQQNQQQTQLVFKNNGLQSPVVMTEVISYEADVIFKKIKLKDKNKRKIISDAIDAYNNKITEIKGFGFLEFNAANKLVKDTKDQVELSNDFQLIRKAQKKLRAILFPIRKKVIVQQNILELVVKRELSPKQYKKWLKYKKAKIYALRPKSNDKKPVQVQKGQGFRGQNYSRRRGY